MPIPVSSDLCSDVIWILHVRTIRGIKTQSPRIRKTFRGSLGVRENTDDNILSNPLGL